jgi:hypothetical protein
LCGSIVGEGAVVQNEVNRLSIDSSTTRYESRVGMKDRIGDIH